MSTPLTRDELRAEFAPLATKADLESPLTKIELECWGEALLARLDAIEHRVLAELARQTRAIVASMSPQSSVIGEKYAYQPPPVSRLEG